MLQTFLLDWRLVWDCLPGHLSGVLRSQADWLIRTSVFYLLLLLLLLMMMMMMMMNQLMDQCQLESVQLLLLLL